MLKTVILLPDGTELSSGVGQENAVQEITLTQCVNAGQELTLGSCCANMVEIKLLTPGGGVHIAAGDALTVYREAEDGTRYPVGVFIAEKPTHPTAHSMSVTAYDRVVLLDRDLTGWLAGLSQWPYTLYTLAEMTCRQCGLTLINGSIPNGEYLVQRFSGEGITGRHLMQWIGELAGRFCRATAAGEIEFAWYTPLTTHALGFGADRISYLDGNLTIDMKESTLTYADNALALNTSGLSVTQDGNGNVTLALSGAVEHRMYYQNGLRFEDYTVAAIEKVQLRQHEEDVGTVYPDGLEGEVNTYIITANPLLTAFAAEALQPVAKNLYEILKDVRYTPCQVSVPANMDICAGHILPITDRNGKTITAYVMQKTQKGQLDTLECTGSPSRDSTTAVNNRSFADLQGKVMSLRTNLEGLYAEHSNTARQVGEAELRLQSYIDMTAEGIRTQVSRAQKTADRLDGTVNALTETVSAKMTQEQVELAIRQELGKGADKVVTATGFTFDDEGLTVEKSNSEMKTQITEDGMAVYKNGQEVLRANNQGVVATDLKARTYLIVGGNSRFEDYGAGRTGCFWIG